MHIKERNLLTEAVGGDSVFFILQISFQLSNSFNQSIERDGFRKSLFYANSVIQNFESVASLCPPTLPPFCLKNFA
jgi:hypothetical protein